MIAKTTIISDEVIQRGIPRDDLLQNVSDMAVALQWHVVYNGTEPVALATSRSAETGVGKKDVLLVVCDCKRGRTHDLHAASVLARYIFDAYNARQGRFVPNGIEPSAERTDIARWLADAIIEGLRHLYEGEVVPAGGPATSAAPITNAGAMKDVTAAVTAAVIHHDKLLVARYGDGRVYLLRGGMLQNLTDESFADATHSDRFEPDLGQLDLVGEDRIVLCTEPLYRRLQDPQIRSVLRHTPAARRAAQTLLDLATKAPTDDNIAIAVADYVTGRPGIFEAPPPRASGAPVTGPRRGTFRRLLSVVALLVLLAAIGAVAVIYGGELRTLFGSALPSVVASPTSDAAAVLAETATAEASATAGAAAPTATLTHTPTSTPTSTPAPTTEPTPVPTVAVVVGVVTHTVRAGDTPLEIARAYNISLDELLRNNPGLNPTNLKIGQELIIRPGDAAPGATPIATSPQPSPTPRPTRRPPTATPVPPSPTPLPPTPVPTDTPAPAPPPAQPPSQPEPPPPPSPTAPPCPPGADC